MLADMKISSRDEYLRRVDRVVARLSAAIASGESLPSVPDLARDARLSEFHFMRVYRALAGESLGATVQRLRISQAVHLLRNTSLPISLIAERVCFETPQAFARAFRQMLDLSPSDVRDQDIDVTVPPAPETPSRAPVIRVEVVELEPFRAMALRNYGAYDDLDRSYARLFAWLGRRPAVATVQGIWGIPHHDRRDTPASECVFDCCVVTSVPLEPDDVVTTLQLGGGQYLMTQSTGPYALLEDAHDALLRDALPEHAATLIDAPILHEFLNDPDHTPPAKLETRIYVPIEPVRSPRGGR